MADEVRIVGAEHLAEAGRRLKAAGDGELRKEMLAGIRTAVKKIIPDVQNEAGILPSGGGLASLVARQKFAVRTSLTSGKVSLVGSGMKELTDIDQGRVRHRVFGRDQWVLQSVTPGFFSKPVATNLPKVRSEIEKVMSDVAQKIERPL